MAEESETAVLAALAGNGALTLLEGTAALFTGSAAMLAETLHSLRPSRPDRTRGSPRLPVRGGGLTTSRARAASPPV
jgi:hypothetical protein